jgi:hypothetical protein
MKFQLTLLAFLAAAFCGHASPEATDAPAVTNRVFMIEPSSMPVGGGTATLKIGALQRVNGIYVGDYTVTVFPYFFKNDHGKLAIMVSDESLTEINLGKTVAVVGTATSYKDGICRHIDAIARPFNIHGGTIKLWFMVEDRKMIFEPLYHLAQKAPPSIFGGDE